MGGTSSGGISQDLAAEGAGLATILSEVSRVRVSAELGGGHM